MAIKTFNNVRLNFKHDTEENWLKATNFIPNQGEPIVYDIDSTYNYERFKIGDGVTNVNDLPFINSDSSSIELITIADIDEICNGNIVSGNEVTY